MASFGKVRIAAIQATPVILDAEASIDKAIGLLREAAVRNIAIESGAFVVSVPQYIPKSAFPADFPAPLPADKDVFGTGGAAIIEPRWGKVIAGPLYGEEGILYADCDLREGLRAKRWFDAVGHYSREDLFVSEEPDEVHPESQEP